jgi:hypothetical protein
MLAHHYLQALELTTAAGGSTTPFSGAAREAFTDAGDRALALHAYDTAVRFFRAALDLLPDGDLRRGRLLLRLGRALYYLGETDPGVVEVLEGARDELLAAGDTEGAVEAEATLCEQQWMTANATAHSSTSAGHGAWSIPCRRHRRKRAQPRPRRGS